MRQVRNMLVRREQQQPVDWLHRFVLFLQAFFVVFIAYSVFQHMEAKHYAVTAAFLLVYAIIEYENRKQPARIALAVGKAAKRQEQQRKKGEKSGGSEEGAEMRVVRN